MEQIPQDTMYLLWTIVTVLCGVIVALALYVRKLHQRFESRLLQFQKDNLEVLKDHAAIMAANTEVTRQQIQATKEQTETVNELHLFIVGALKK
jgi:predicted Holliday junction resolvase-like endonuclease